MRINGQINGGQGITETGSMDQNENTQYLYQPERAKESCGFGLIAHQHGETSHELVSTACTALARMTHRGAVAVDGKTGDGCGVLMQFPESFFRDLAAEGDMWLGRVFAVGMVFINSDEKIAAHSRKILKKHISIYTVIG